MWQCVPEPLPGGRVVRFVPRDPSGAQLPYRDGLRLLRTDETFRGFFASLLSAAPFDAFRWETPPVDAATVDRAFEFVLLDAPALNRPPDAEAFEDRFRSARDGRQVVAFPNLGNDAVLVVPCPAGPPETYAHLAAFVRGAPAAQVHELWQTVAAEMESRLSAAPVWLSTAGMGVSWLHVRLDARPKYYGFGAYREGR